MKNVIHRTLILLTFFLASCGGRDPLPDAQAASPTGGAAGSSMEGDPDARDGRDAAAMTAEIVAMLQSLYNDDDPGKLRQLAAPDLRHYSSKIADGVEAWADFAASVAHSKPLIAIHQTVSEGDTVGVHAHYRWNPDRELDGGAGVAVAHVFTIESGKIVAAIELTQPVQTETASGNDMFSQQRPSVTPQDAERNRATAEKVMTEFLPGNTSLRGDLLGDYVQHNPLTPDCAEGIAGFVESINGATNDYRWTMVEDGQAWSFTRYHANPSIGVPALVTIDIWQFDGSGRIAEHWDVLEADFTSPSGHTFDGLAASGG